MIQQHTMSNLPILPNGGADKTISYREPLCLADNKGVPFFSPMCNPDFRPVEIKEERVIKHAWGDASCRVTPLQQPKAQVEQYTDKESAYDWFKDPTYAQRISIRKKGLDDAALDVNPSLRMYHQLKTMEKMGGSLMQTL